MHEQGLFNDMIHKVTQVVNLHHASRATRITIRLGALSNISADHFLEHFNEARAGSVAEEAEIEIHKMEDPSDRDALQMVLESIEVE